MCVWLRWLFNIVCDFDPACNESGWWSVAGDDGPEPYVNGEGRFVRGLVKGFVEATGGRVPVFVIQWPALFVMAVCHTEAYVVLFFRARWTC